MGSDKALLDFGGVPLILHTARLLEPLVAEVTIVGSRQYAALGLHAITDIAEKQSTKTREAQPTNPQRLLGEKKPRGMQGLAIMCLD